MYEQQRILAVVPARSGSKGIRNKNMQHLAGVSLIGRAGQVLSQLPWIDRAVISTDSEAYAEEGKRYGLAAPFLRPAHLAADTSTAVDAMQHAVTTCEALDNTRYDIVLIVEPTSAMRVPKDITACVHKLATTDADTVLTVSTLDRKAHPDKLFTLEQGQIHYLTDRGKQISNRQQLSSNLYWRNGLCYAIRRDVLMVQGLIIAPNTRAVIVERPVVNIDEPLDLLWAEFLLQQNDSLN
jgi:CMP-N,N'-diacetyllegionaminic acid synthase